ncbi:MAG: FAD-binding protein, partial [Gammaproteobacteria bacterium]|nr:FAD-binding protein [Gammaproteobacteria bacterium]
MHDVPLQTLNTLGLPANAQRLFVLDDEAQLGPVSGFLASDPRALILGSGSNIVFADAGVGAVLLNRLRGRRIVATAADHVDVEFAAGESWHEAVCWSLEQALSGLENLALIPGTVGAAPVQNIGAYGVEIGERVLAVRV